MDRQSTIGMILIFILLVIWMMWNAPAPQQPQRIENKQEVVDTVKTTGTSQVLQDGTPSKSVDKETELYSKFFAARAKGTERIVTIETDKIRAELTTRGGRIRRWELKGFKTWDGYPVQFVSYNHGGDLSVLFTTKDGRVVNTGNLFFDTDALTSHIVIDNNLEFEIKFVLPASNGGALTKKMKFKNGVYDCDVTIEFSNLQDVLANYQYEVAWEHGVRYFEHNSVDEASFGAALVYAGHELTEIDAHELGKTVEKEMGGTVDWVAVRNKYFSVALIPITHETEGAYLAGTRISIPDNGVNEIYSVALRMPFKGLVSEQTTLKLFAGPLDHSVLKSYNKNLEQLMSLGWSWLVRPLAEYLFLPLFKFIHDFVPNWGLVIIIFSIIIKIALHPLTKKSTESMQKMQKLQPMFEEIREKYKEDPQKMNQAIMNLYREYGVNPAGGCLPLLLQLPIMYALYFVFRGAIELRQSSFIWWITDLSVPDVIYSLPFRIPLVGIQDVSGIALFMGITMFIQSKMTIKDPRQKMTVWLMPILMTLLFNGFPSGLNLYYAMFNVLGIVQQAISNKTHKDEPLRKVEQKKKRKGGVFKNIPTIPRLRR
ncbi:MAG: membrane protein insertase YidC [Bacteroidetes bacterium]|nr:membrane protein insertase YidC [Bacteroidota bacterium]